MSISSSLRTLAFKLPYQILTFTPNSNSNSPLRKPSSFSPFKSISFERQRLVPKTSPTKPPNSLPSPSAIQPIDELPPKLQEIITLFQGVQQPKAKYEQLLFYGRNLPPLDDRYKTRANKVQGCVSQVWVRAYLDPDANVWFEADSDSVLTKGLAALLVLGLSGRPVPEIVLVKPDFITLLGLQQSLSPSRNNGFLNMLKLMQKKAQLLALEDQTDIDQSELGIEGEIESSNLGSGNGNGGVELQTEGNSTEGLNTGSGNDNGGAEPGAVTEGRAERIREKLQRELSPIELEVEDVSYQHAGHAGNRTGEDGTHINLKIVTKEFEGKSVVKRHRMIYALLQDELESGLHALSIVAKAPGEAMGPPAGCKGEVVLAFEANASSKSGVRFNKSVPDGNNLGGHCEENRGFFSSANLLSLENPFTTDYFFEVAGSESKNEPLILFLKDMEKFMTGNSDAYGALKINL